MQPNENCRKLVHRFVCTNVGCIATTLSHTSTNDKSTDNAPRMQAFTRLDARYFFFRAIR